MARRRTRRMVRLATACALVWAGTSWPAIAATEVVRVPGNNFDPPVVRIFLNDTVEWRMENDEGHSVTAASDSRAAGESFDSNPRCATGLFTKSRCLRQGESYSRKFTHTGTFTYYCRHHGSNAPYPDCGMCGQVLVTRRPTGNTTPPTPPPGTVASPSGSPTGTVSPTGTDTASPTSTLAGGPGGVDDGNGAVVAVAAVGVALLAASGIAVYRSMIARR